MPQPQFEPVKPLFPQLYANDHALAWTGIRKMKPLQRRIMGLLSDGEAHFSRELYALVPNHKSFTKDKLQSYIKIYVCILRKKLKKYGQDIIRIGGRKCNGLGYRLIGVLKTDVSLRLIPEESKPKLR